MVNLTHAWLINNLTKPRRGLTKVNLRELIRRGRIWNIFCIVSKVGKLNVSRVPCLWLIIAETSRKHGFELENA